MRENNLFQLKNNLYWGIFALLTIIYIKGLFNLVYGVDANIYASISKEMLDTENWLEIYHKGKDYLDKPPLHFWLSALSYKIFGVSSFAYKFPSFLFTLLGTYSLFRLGKLLYSTEIGKLASLLFYSCFAIIIINQDVRTDTILVGIVVFSVWQLIEYIKTNSYLFFIGGFIGIGLAMLAKGPIGLMVPVLALGMEFLIKKQWNNIFKWQWLLGIVIVGLVISPMLFGLYSQFDSHPNKIMNLSSGLEVKGISGLKFYFWDQSFGRITGDNKEWRNDATPLFFTHTYLWSFLPWSILGVFALFTKIKNSFTNIKNSEFVTLGAIILPFIAFSMSSYKLPHYIYVFFPFWILITANYLVNLKSKSWIKTNYIIQIVLIVILSIASLLLIIYAFPTHNLFIWASVIALTIYNTILLFKLNRVNSIIYGSSIAIVVAAFVFNFHFIPSISQYDAPSRAAIFSRTLKINHVYSNSVHSIAFDIYSNNPVEYKDIYDLKNKTNNNNYIFVKENNFDKLKNKYQFKHIYEFKHKGITSLTLPFLNPKTRDSQLESYYLLEI